MHAAVGVDYAREDLVRGGFSSQCGQDRWIAEACFPDLRKGVFVDIGAHDGVTFSNTLYLESKRQWTGIAIEPVPVTFEKLARNRNCISINGCIAGTSGVAKFREITGYSEMLSGLVDQYDQRHLERIAREVEFHGGSWRDVDVRKFRLNELLGIHGLQTVNYLNIDVEGAELEILRSIDFSIVDIQVCGVENNYRDPRIPALMKGAGYAPLAVVGDEMYVKLDSDVFRRLRK